MPGLPVPVPSRSGRAAGTVTILAADEADLAALGEFGRRLEDGPKDPRAEWRRIARPDQLLPPLEDPWRILLLTGGRGSGKSRSGAQGLVDIILGDTEAEGQYGIIAPTYRDAWTVDVEGESGLLRALATTAGEVKHGKSRLVEYAHRSYGEIGLRNGHVIYVDSADDGALRVQGKNLRAVWCDEIGLWLKWQVAWDESIRYAVRKGASKIIATGTPKVSRPARALIRRLLRGDEPGVIVRRLRTEDNAANLSEAFYQSVIGAAKGTRLERQELEGELLDDVANALWTRDLLESIQVPAVGAEGGIPYLFNAVSGVDPSDGNEDSDEQAYAIAGKGARDDHRLYVVESFGAQMAPAAFARKVILKAVEWHARIVVERNHGGAWLTETFHQVLRELDAAGRLPDGRKPRVETIWASQSKRTRAEPVSALYERGIVRHAGGPFVELEDQQCIAAGEPVTTARGSVPVEQVRVGDLVITRAGWCPVIRAIPAGIKQTVTITTDAGSLTCSDDHPVYVRKHGFIRADEVQSGDIMVTCRSNPPGPASSSTARSITWTMTGTTRPAEVADGTSCTVTSGSSTTARSRRDGTSTTDGRAKAAMTSATFMPCPVASTSAITSAGILPARGENRPLPKAPSARRSGPGGSTATTPARSAVSLTNRGLTSRPATAHLGAATRLCTAAVLNVSASGVRPCHDLTVAGQPEFFAGTGALLVHNCSYTAAAGERSPDRLDALVFSLHPFLNTSFGPPGAPGVRRWAGAAEMDAAGLGEETRAARKIREIAGRGQAPEGAPWDLDGFAAQDDDEVAAAGRRGNVRSWQ